MKSEKDIRQLVSDLETVMPSCKAHDDGFAVLGLMTIDALRWALGEPGTACGHNASTLREIVKRKQNGIAPC